MSLAINSCYLDEEFLKCWSDKSNSKKVTTSDDSIIITEPFRCCALRNFIDFSAFKRDFSDTPTSSDCKAKYEQTYMELLRKEVEQLELHEKKNDLYSFRQSDDLHNIKLPAIDALKELFSGPVKEWLQQLTGIELDVRVALTASAYGFTDHLLCHDDELENRRIAFAFYLTPGWSENHGGSLDVFSSDDKLRPCDIVESIVPYENTLSFFEVVPKSFHQVSEVVHHDQIRWSINGWFHGATIERPAPIMESMPERIQPGSVELDDLLAWINPQYIDPGTQCGIREEFREESQIQLHDFLQPERYESVLKELEHPELKWCQKGPWNRRHYFTLDGCHELDKDRFPNLHFCLRLMHSEAMYLLLSQFTGLRLHALYDGVIDEEEEENDSEDNVDCMQPEPKKLKMTNGEAEGESSVTNGNADAASCSRMNVPDATKSAESCQMELRKFVPGSYTLLSDVDFTSEDALDAQLCFTPHSWDTHHGGFTCYIEAESTEELLTVIPRSNSLSLVFRELGTQRFVKYINKRTIRDFDTTKAPAYFSDISAVYYEVGSTT